MVETAYRKSQCRDCRAADRSGAASRNTRVGNIISLPNQLRTGILLQVSDTLFACQGTGDACPGQLLQLLDVKIMNSHFAIRACRRKALAVSAESEVLYFMAMRQLQQFIPGSGVPHSGGLVPASCRQAAPVMVESHLFDDTGVSPKSTQQSAFRRDVPHLGRAVL